MRRILDANVTNPGAWLELAASLRRQGAYEAAMRTYEVAERRFPLLAQVPNNRGVLLREAGLLEEALGSFGRAVLLKQDYGAALEGQGNVLELLGRFTEAERVYRTLLRYEPERATAWNNLGNCAHQLGRSAEAEKCFRRALTLDPEYVVALTNLAGLLDENGDRAQAEALTQRALVLQPDDETALLLAAHFDQQAPPITMHPPAAGRPSTPGWLQAATELRRRVEDVREAGRVVPDLLGRSRVIADRTGFMSWHTDRLAEDPVGDPGPTVVRLSMPTPSAPRLFIAYAWEGDPHGQVVGGYELDLMTYAIAGDLFNRGYQLVFDRDPRNLDKSLSEIDVLRRLYDCNYFVPVVTERYLEKIALTSVRSNMVRAEWDLACRLADAGFLVFAGIWLEGTRLPSRLTAANTADVRDGGNFAPSLRTYFPDAREGSVGMPRVAMGQRPPEPPDWPARTTQTR